MKSILYRWSVAVFAVMAVAAAPRAEDMDALAFDIFKSNGSVAVWIDLASFISSRRVEQLHDGINVAIECQLSLRRPRRLWGSETILESQKLLRVEYRLITEDYRLRSPSQDTASEWAFPSLAKLHQFLNDSIVVILGNLNRLDNQQRYYVEMKLTCIALTSFNLASGDEQSDTDESAVRFLFRQFLDVTNFGREGFAISSRRFSVDELESLE